MTHPDPSDHQGQCSQNKASEAAFSVCASGLWSKLQNLGSSLSREAKTSPYLDTSFSSSRGIQWHSQVIWETEFLQHVLVLPQGILPAGHDQNSSRKHPKQMPEPLQLAPFDVEGQGLYSELPLDDRAPHCISKGLCCHTEEESHFFYPRSCPFSHDPEFMHIGESRNIDWW